MTMRIINSADPRRMILAKKIIEHARCGERDPMRLREAVLIELQNSVEMGVIRLPPSSATTGLGDIGNVVALDQAFVPLSTSPDPAPTAC
jgi:hypothetical protein